MAKSDIIADTYLYNADTTRPADMTKYIPSEHQRGQGKSAE
jgi:hypothetical protein